MKFSALQGLSMILKTTIMTCSEYQMNLKRGMLFNKVTHESKLNLSFIHWLIKHKIGTHHQYV